MSISYPMHCSLPGSSVQGILQARILGWIAMPFSRRSSPPRDPTHVCCSSCTAGRFFTAKPSTGKLTLLSIVIQTQFLPRNIPMEILFSQISYDSFSLTQKINQHMHFQTLISLQSFSSQTSLPYPTFIRILKTNG